MAVAKCHRNQRFFGVAGLSCRLDARRNGDRRNAPTADEDGQGSPDLSCGKHTVGVADGLVFHLS
jgi:hypothetical protein